MKFFKPSFSNTGMRLYFDRLPDTCEKIALFKNTLSGLSLNKDMKKIGLLFNSENITDVSSHDHVILQCVDIVLGAMQFRLNNLHKIKLSGCPRRGKRTVAKEKVYKFINSRIKSIYPNFNIGITTGIKNDISRLWEDPYRHRLFVPNGYSKDFSKTKKAIKSNPVLTIPSGNILSGT